MFIEKKKKLYIFFRCGDPTQMPRGPARFGVQTYQKKKLYRYLAVHIYIILLCMFDIPIYALFSSVTVVNNDIPTYIWPNLCII